MNINKIVDDLRKVPDEALISYVQQPNGRVPSVLALSELQRRKEIRQSAGAKQPSPTQTVAQQVMAQPAPQGVAALPVADNMYSEQSMAAGGIVAFDEGGEVPSYQLGGLTADNIAYQRALAQTSFDPTEAIRRGFAYTQDVLTAPGQLSWMRDPKTGKLVRAYEVEGFMPRSTGFSAAENAKVQSRLASLDAAEADNITRANLAGKSPRLGAEKEGVRQLVADATRSDNAMMDRMVDIPTVTPVKSVRDKTIRNQQVADKVIATGDVGTQGANKTQRQASSGYGDLVFDPVKVDEAGYDKFLPKDQSMRDYAAEFKAELGEDPSRAAVKERLAKMQAAGETDSARAPWMALAEAGLGMAAGQSQFALQNIAAGGIRGIQSYNEARDRLMKAEERRFELENKVSQAERAEQLAAINYGADSKRADDASRRTIGLAKQQDLARAAEVNARGKLEAVEKRYGLEQKDRELSVTQEHYRQMAKAYNKTPAEIQMVYQYAQSKGIPFAQAFEAVMGMKHPGSGGLDEDTIMRSYSSGVDKGTIDPTQTPYQTFKKQIMGGGTDYSTWGSPKISGK
jgi:hypothetical protein